MTDPIVPFSIPHGLAVIGARAPGLFLPSECHAVLNEENVARKSGGLHGVVATLASKVSVFEKKRIQRGRWSQTLALCLLDEIPDFS